MNPQKLEQLVEAIGELKDKIESGRAMDVELATLKESMNTVNNRLSLLERIVFGTIGIAGTAVILSLIYLVLKKQQP